MNKQLQNIMNLAWQMVKSNGYTISEALKQAWQVIKLRVKMTKQVVKFTFKKVDGSIREALGTLKSDETPQTVSSGKKSSKAVQVYYDVEKMAWRCFKVENLTSFE